MSLTDEQQTELNNLEAAFTEAGGRGVDLAERIDALRRLRDASARVRPIDPDEELPDKDEGEFTYGDTDEEIAADNFRRATFAAVAVKAYAQATSPSGEEITTLISDLFGDLRHLLDCLAAGCDDERALEFSFENLSDRGWCHYAPETRGEL